MCLRGAGGHRGWGGTRPPARSATVTCSLLPSLRGSIHAPSTGSSEANNRLLVPLLVFVESRKKSLKFFWKLLEALKGLQSSPVWGSRWLGREGVSGRKEGGGGQWVAGGGQHMRRTDSSLWSWCGAVHGPGPQLEVCLPPPTKHQQCSVLQ